jgi:LPS sulfotransferase NodH
VEEVGILSGWRGTSSKLGRSFKRAAKRSPALRGLYYRLIGARHRLRMGSTASGSVDPALILWIFCTSRSGSTWLRRMLRDALGCEVWEEPKVGQLFGDFHHRAKEAQRGSISFIMGDPTRQVWLRSIREFVLNSARACNPSLKPGRFLVIKEPDGAVGAPLVMEALPESRMVLLLRDPRDVAASSLDARRKGGWMDEVPGTADPGRDPDDFIRRRSRAYLRQMNSALRAYETHRGRKSLVRYEDLRADPAKVMQRLAAELELPVSGDALRRAVEKHSWEKVPAEEKGEGRFYRKARPGGWREDLSAAQVRSVEEITAPILKKFYRGP